MDSVPKADLLEKNVSTLPKYAKEVHISKWRHYATLRWEMGKNAILNAAWKEHTLENENQDLSVFANNKMELIIIGCTSTNTHTNTNTNTDTFANQHTNMYETNTNTDTHTNTINYR